MTAAEHPIAFSWGYEDGLHDREPFRLMLHKADRGEDEGVEYLYGYDAGEKRRKEQETDG